MSYMSSHGVQSKWSRLRSLLSRKLCFKSSSSKDFKGKFEYEVLGPGLESEESAHAWQECDKYDDGHAEFIPATSLTVDLLPQIARSQNVLRLIQAVATLTVRLRVNATSSRRPDYGEMCEGSDNSAGPRTGTGFVTMIYRSRKTCSCPGCSEQPSTSSHPSMASRECWCVEIRTASHVVYNLEEVLATCVDLFYDDEECRHNGRMQTLWGARMVDAQYEKDWCVFHTTTQDPNLARRLRSYIKVREDCGFYQYKYFKQERPTTCIQRLKNLRVRQRDSSCETSQLPRLSRKHKRYLRSVSDDLSERCDFVFIVSHPHAQPKKVTFREYNKKDSRIQYMQTSTSSAGPLSVKARFVYKAKTCPGSSGALVLFMNEKSDVIDVMTYVHSKTSDDKFTNFSSEFTLPVSNENSSERKKKKKNGAVPTC